MADRSILVTGAGGYVGRQVVAEVAGNPDFSARIIATDIHLPPEPDRLPGVQYEALDVRSEALLPLLKDNKVDSIVHLAAIVTPGKDTTREMQYSVDVLGTRNVLECAAQSGVTHITFTSSGAAYGYHADNPEWIDEACALRGNREFAYADHKRQVEEMLAEWRTHHPGIGQLIFRPGAILGETTANQITALFEQRAVIGLAGSEIPFTFIWDKDVVGSIVKGVQERATGIYNLAGDGAITMREIAELMEKPYLQAPVWMATSVLWLLKRFHLTRYGPEQVPFLRYRPALSNKRLKEEFGYAPRKNSREVFEHFLNAKNALRK